MFYNQLQLLQREIFEFLEEDEEEEDVTDPVVLNPVKGDIEFEHVKFGYDKDQVVIKDLSFKVKAGQQIAIVGQRVQGKLHWSIC
jgi:ATP-binding cassette subfamily B protein